MYTYRISWSSLGVSYYGLRLKYKGTPVEDLWVKYFTSSVYVKAFRKEHGEPDIIEVRQLFSNESKARNWELRVLRRLNVRKNSLWLNRNDGEYHGCTDPKSQETRKKISDGLRGKRKSDDHRAALSKGNRGKYTHITNGVETRHCIPIKDAKEFICSNPEWRIGFTHSDDSKERISERAKFDFVSGKRKPPSYEKNGENNPMYGRLHKEKSKEKISLANKKRYENPENLLMGEKNGMFGKRLSEERKRELSQRSSENRWYTNGQDNMLIHMNKTPPEGWVRGRTLPKRNKEAA